MKQIKLAVVGSRNLKCKNRVYFEINEFRKTYDVTEIISGDCATGIDKFAKDYAIEFKIKYRGIPAEWQNFNPPCIKKHNGRDFYNALAGPNRNTIIADECDLGIVVWDGKSTGTRDVGNKIYLRRKLYKKIVIPT